MSTDKGLCHTVYLHSLYSVSKPIMSGFANTALLIGNGDDLRHLEPPF